MLNACWITAGGDGSNGSRVRLWKRELQRLANEIGIDIAVHHLPPGTSKWNTIEHRLFSFITQNWRAKPPVRYQVIIDLIGATTTETGLKVVCELDTTSYPRGIVITPQTRLIPDRPLARLYRITRHRRVRLPRDPITGGEF
jgi:hypothetical protein